MSNVDVSDMMLDPDFVEPLTLMRRTAAPSTYGENQVVENGFPIVGSVQPISGKELQRIPEAFRVANVYSFWLKETIISDGTNNRYPDIIVRKGVRYQVQSIFDWSSWGAGWSQGTCVQEKPSR